jgi:iron complex outermembrane receptor protein
MRAILLAGIATIATIAAAPAAAQTAAPEPQPASPELAEPGVGLADIVVTAQRRVETAQRAALAIDVVSTDALERAGATNVANLNAVAPSLNVTQGGGATTSFFVRGVGNFTNNAYSDTAVAFNYDGVYIGRPSATGGTFFDLERIEVLKGPQGTLYGRNATGGAVNVLPARPRLDGNALNVSLGYGNYDRVEAEAAANLVIGADAAIRIAGRTQRWDGYNRDGTDDNQSEGLLVQLLVEPTPALTVRIAADYAHTGGRGPQANYIGTVNFAPGSAASATAPASYVFVPANLRAREGLASGPAAAYFAGRVIGGSFNSPAPLATPYLNDQVWGLHGEASLDTGLGEFTLLTAYRETSIDDLFNGPSFRGALDRQDNDQFSAELRLAGRRVGPLDWLLGGYYFDENVIGRTSLNQYIATSVQQYDINTRSIAGFGRLTFHAGEAFRLTAAGRYTSDRKRMDGSAPTLVNICTRPPPPAGPGCFGGPSTPVGLTLQDIAAAIPPALLPLGFPTVPGPGGARPFGSAGNILFFAPINVNQGLKNNKLTYRVAVEADIGPQSLAYVSYETGYRSGGFSLSLGHETFRPETIRALTIGLKNRFFDNRVQLNLEAFHWRYRDQQISHFGLDALGLNSYFTDNAGRSTIKGFDIDAQFKATPTTLLTASVQYLDSKLKEFTYETPRGGTFLPPAVGCPFTPTVDAAGRQVFRVECAGRPNFNSPRWSLDGGIQQELPIGADYKLLIATDARWRSNRVIGFDFLPQQNSGSNFIADASLAFGPSDDAWALTLWGRNLTNELVPVLTQYNASIAGTLTSTYAPPRTYGIRFSARM